VGLDSSGASRGILLRFASSYLLINCCAIFPGLIIELYCKDLDKEITFINLYEPYDDQDAFWQHVFALGILQKGEHSLWR